MTKPLCAGLHENWNRFYDPQTGRYLSPEPMLQKPEEVLGYARIGHMLPPYAYALNNPLNVYDSDGEGPKWELIKFLICFKHPELCGLLPPDPGEPPGGPPGGGGGGGGDICRMPRKGDPGPYRCASKCQAILPASGATYVMGGSTKSCSEATKQAKAQAFAIGGTSVHHCRCADTKGFLGTGHQCE